MIERLMPEFRNIIETDLILISGHKDITKHLLELSRLHIALEKQAKTDELTGLFNRKTFHALVDQGLARRSRSGAELCFCLCDIDHFKDVNDSYGHDVGDVVLKTLAERLKNTLRAYDVIWRWGGEEFLIMCPDSTLEVGLAAIERLRTCVEQQAVAVLLDDLTLHVTMSFGISAIQAGEDIASCLKRCDELLYLAKERGRNRVVSDFSCLS
jgi:diguanylate cyclase (GGDEF)-like protein